MRKLTIICDDEWADYVESLAGQRAGEDAARIAEGETSTIRDVDPGNAQDARRIAAALAVVRRVRDPRSHALWSPDSVAEAVERALTDAGDDASTTPRCHAHRDGECHWTGCPQLRDGEPKASGRHCPLDPRED